MSQFNFFAESEQATQQKFRDWRCRLLLPLTRALSTVGLTPNLISVLGILALVPFVYQMVLDPSASGALRSFPWLLLHVALDGLDGPLARFQNRASKSGTLVDMTCDHLGMAVVTITMVQAGLLNGPLGCAYLFFYTTAVVFLIVLNQLNRPLKFALRSKYLVYGLLLLYGLTGNLWLNWVIPLFVACDVLTSVLGFRKLYRYLGEESSIEAHTPDYSPT